MCTSISFEGVLVSSTICSPSPRVVSNNIYNRRSESSKCSQFICFFGPAHKNPLLNKISKNSVVSLKTHAIHEHTFSARCRGQRVSDHVPARGAQGGASASRHRRSGWRRTFLPCTRCPRRPARRQTTRRWRTAGRSWRRCSSTRPRWCRRCRGSWC